MHMGNDKYNVLYFDWLCRFICDNQCLYLHNGKNYSELLMFLHDIEFTYSLRLDENRYVDGIDFRRRFARDHYDTCWDAEEEFKDIPCSVLEMMTALVVRCEEHIMCDSQYGDRTPLWFWSMINYLGLIDMYDGNFSENYAWYAVSTMLNRTYEYNGRGGLFVLRNPRMDMREADIWHQINWWFTENYM